MSLTRPYYYWTETRFAATSNAHVPTAAPLTVSHQAERNDDDEYVRSIWHAELSYVSDMSTPVVGWWGQAQVRLVINWDPLNMGVATDIGTNSKDNLGFFGMNPRYSVWPDASAYQVSWCLDGSQLTLQTPRLGVLGDGRPAVLANLYYYDQNGFFAGTEAASVRRAQITGRILWASSSGP